MHVRREHFDEKFGAKNGLIVHNKAHPGTFYLFLKATFSFKISFILADSVFAESVLADPVLANPEPIPFNLLLSV